LQPFYPVNWIEMLPEWHEQLRSGDQGFLFRAMVTTESAEITDIFLWGRTVEPREAMLLRHPCQVALHWLCAAPTPLALISLPPCAARRTVPLGASSTTVADLIATVPARRTVPLGAYGGAARGHAAPSPLSGGAALALRGTDSAGADLIATVRCKAHGSFGGVQHHCR
jgi:hypothetical protein